VCRRIGTYMYFFVFSNISFYTQLNKHTTLQYRQGAETHRNAVPVNIFGPQWFSGSFLHPKTERVPAKKFPSSATYCYCWCFWPSYENRFRPGFCLGPRWGSLLRSPDPLVGWGEGYPCPFPRPRHLHGCVAQW